MSDPKQRLQDKLAANRARREAEARSQLGSTVRHDFQALLSALEGGCERFKLLDAFADQRWIPRWQPWGPSRIRFEYAPSVDDAVKHLDDPAGRRAALRAILGAVAPPDGEVLIIYEHDALAVRLSREAAQRHAGAAVERDPRWGARPEVWFSDPLGEWIITSGHNYTFLYRAPPPERWTRAEVREGLSWIEPLRRGLISRGVRYRLVRPVKGAQMRETFPNWKRDKPLLSAAVPPDREGRRALIGGFIASRTATQDRLLIIPPAYSPATPKLAVRAGDLADHVDMVVETLGTFWIKAAEGKLAISVRPQWVYGTA